MTGGGPQRPSIHASAVAIGPHGLLIRGPSGAGKSTLALALVARIAAAGRFARVVADDRVILAVHGGRLLASAPGRLDGLAEAAHLGIIAVPSLPRVRLSHVVDLSAHAERLPPARRVTLEGVTLPGLILPQRAHARAMVLVHLFLEGAAPMDACGTG